MTEEEEVSFSEIYASAALNGEVVITIPPEELERVKTGLKNFKAKQAQKMKAEGLMPDPSVFIFTERECLDADFRDNFIDLSIQLARKSTVKVAKIRIPENDF
jgi:hypothetical protein